MMASISASSAASPSCSSPPRRMDRHQDQHSCCCSSSATSDQLLQSTFHRVGQPGTRVFQSCIQGKAAKQLLLQQLVLEVIKILDEEDGDDRDSDAAINNERRTAMVKEETPCLPLRTRTDSIQRIRRNLNLKRSSWQQVALRGRTKEARDHEATLHLLRDAAKRAAKRAMMDESTQSVASRTDSSIDGDSVRASALLEEARAAGRPPRSSAISSGRGSAASTTSSSSEGARGEGVEITRCISATKIQALARGRTCRRRLKRRREQRRRLASFTKQQHKSYLPPPPTLSDYRRRVLERQSSEITMSDFGDSTHYDPSTLISLSSHHTIISILEVDDEENDDDDDEYDEFQLPRDDEQLPSSDDNWDETDSLHSFEGLNDLKYSLGCSNGYTDLGGTRSNGLLVSSPSPRMNVPAAIGHASFSSYFGIGMVLGDKPIRRPERILSPGRDNGKKKWCEDDEEVSLPEVPFGEDHDDLLDDDDDDLRPSFAMHRSEGSLDFFGDLHRRPTTFRRPRPPPNEGEDNYFHHSMSGSSSSFSSRWDGSVAPLPSPSLPPPEQQRIASKAAISTYLPVRPPSRKLSNNVNTTNNNNDSNGSMDIVFSTLISAKASPKLPLRKCSTTPPLGGVCGVVERVSPVASNNNNLVPSQVSVQEHVPCEIMESSPKLPLRKVSMSAHGESTHTRSTIGEGGPASDIKPQLSYELVEGRRGEAPLVVADAPFRIPERKLSELPTSHHSSSTKNSICDTFRQTVAKAPAFSSGQEPDPQDNDEEPTSPQRTEGCLSSPTSTDTSSIFTPASIDVVVPGTTITSVLEGEEYVSSPDSSSCRSSPRRIIASRSIGSWIQQRVQNLIRRSKMDNRKGQKQQQLQQPTLKPMRPKKNVFGGRNTSTSSATVTSVSNSGDSSGCSSSSDELLFASPRSVIVGHPTADGAQQQCTTTMLGLLLAEAQEACE